MKRFVLYIITAVIVLGGVMSEHDAERLPFLISHYQKHKAKNPISFWEFLCMHYGESAHKEREHESLPFKHTDCAAAHILVFLPPASPSPPAPAEQLRKATTPFFFLRPFGISRAIWQPPKLG